MPETAHSWTNDGANSEACSQQVFIRQRQILGTNSVLKLNFSMELGESDNFDLQKILQYEDRSLHLIV